MPFYTTKSTALHIQVAKMMKTKEKSFMLKHVDVQCQSGASECALFAIAHAMALCTDSDPHLTNFVQEDLRAHLYKCFDSCLMLPFPAPDHKRRAGRQRIIHAKSVDVFCICRLPWNRNNCKKGALVQCQMYKEWCHEECMGITADILDIHF